jgi:hypothetical protein
LAGEEIMGEKSITEQSRESAERNSDAGASPGSKKTPRDTARAYVDPAQAVMESNPNPSPPIHPNR